jgi:tripartite-type tricarboxylate transporter receptor subunit TctC
MKPVDEHAIGPTRRITLRLALAAIAMMGVAADGHAQSAADQFPNRPVTIVVPFPAGGTADLTGRIVGQALARKWNQTVIIENKPGAGGNLGADAVFRATPDGYTLLVTPQSPLVINQHLFENLRFDPAKFESIALIVKLANALVMGAQASERTVVDVISTAKAAPDKLTTATQGNGTSSHLTAELFQMVAGVKLRVVPYRGSAPALVDLAGGNVNMMFDNLGSSLQLAQAGKLRLIAVASPSRLPALPDVPTIAETLPGFQSETWNAMVAPPGTPADVADKINADVNQILHQPEVIKAFADLTGEVTGGPRAAMAAYVKQESDRWGSVIRSAGIKLQ